MCASKKDIERLIKLVGPTIAGSGDGWYDDDEEGFERFVGSADQEEVGPKRPEKKAGKKGKKSKKKSRK